MSGTTSSTLVGVILICRCYWSSRSWVISQINSASLASFASLVPCSSHVLHITAILSQCIRVGIGVSVRLESHLAPPYQSTFPVSQPAPFLDMTLTSIVVTTTIRKLALARVQLCHAHLAVTTTIPTPTPVSF